MMAKNRRVDAAERLRRKTVRAVEVTFKERNWSLTMGGEPTFVALDSKEAEWRTEALGPTKVDFAWRCANRFTRDHHPGAFSMQVYGKRYPGEPLPRWNVLTLWKRRGVLWRDRDRLVADDSPGQNFTNDAYLVASAIARRLRLGRFLVPAAEEDADGEAAGWILPLDFVDDAWTSSQWPYSEDNPIGLIAGDSPIGLRLPLEDLEEGLLKRALSVECVRGRLQVFLPPLDGTGFEKLLRALADVAKRLDLNDILFCGYPPPPDPRLRSLGLNADPGVLEANLPICATWNEYQEILQQLYDCAAKVGLTSMKRYHDGRLVSTGGGSHLAFGGPEPEASPFLRDPRMVASVLRYWQRHPALAFAFTGLYVGPGCQAPRADEVAVHALDEMALVCRSLESDPPPPPETIDLLLANLLVDAAGNTHRAEICVDKLWNWRGPAGALGILELRAFEAMPDAAMASAVGLFVRAILARLARASCLEPLRRWGAELHDRYFLPRELWRDIEGIVTDLNDHGIPFDLEWLRPVFDFRFPLLGCLEVGSGSIEIRQGLEAWPLLAEESSGQNTVRLVDSSNERIEFRLSGAELQGKGMLLVNGVPVPFHPSGSRWIAGIRFKACRVYREMQPQVPAQSPLRVEWVDGRRERVQAAGILHGSSDFPPVPPGPPPLAGEEWSHDVAWRWEQQEEGIGERRELIVPEDRPDRRVTIDLRYEAL